jgi:hypothetical protein
MSNNIMIFLFLLLAFDYSLIVRSMFFSHMSLSRALSLSSLVGSVFFFLLFFFSNLDDGDGARVNHVNDVAC